MTGGPTAYRGGQATVRHRAASIGIVVALHAGLVGAFVAAQLGPTITPPEPTLSVSFITETPASTAPTPPQPPPPAPRQPPKTQMLATERPSASPMTAPPMEREPQRETPTQPAPSAPPSLAAPSNAPVAATTTPPNFTAAYLKNPGAVYPIGSRRRREQGVVRLRVQVSAEGAPAQVLLDRSSGWPELDAAAMDVVKKRWKFAPAKQGDRAVSAWVIVPMEFSLNR
ncbi:MAG: energy transducer TonB [Phenylobacterium sp.]|nr:energy transducer TonB [Phenylobacterium sp.]MBP7816873.1 energy transducer TonB [Phenylobacterium sp.]MBP9231743.1 energy transducer TonB [Phenylobacterium sp.]MBP9755783.1 energy transducer TonB [Phenylobacterium sp.]